MVSLKGNIGNSVKCLASLSINSMESKFSGSEGVQCTAKQSLTKVASGLLSEERVENLPSVPFHFTFLIISHQRKNIYECD